MHLPDLVITCPSMTRSNKMVNQPMSFLPVSMLKKIPHMNLPAIKDFAKETRALGIMPESAPLVVPWSLVAWLVAFVLGHFLHEGTPYLYLG